jgi:CBS domain-containing protein
MDVSGSISSIIGQKGSQIWSITPEATVFDAIQLMADKNVGALLVLRDGALLGLISERDYTRKVMLRGKRSKETQVQEIMTNEPTVVSPNESVENCLRTMTAERIRHLPVVDGQEIRGIISIGDLVKWTISHQAAALDQLESYISGGYPG